MFIIYLIDHHTTSFYEFIYSYRKEKSSPFPQLNSQETRDAFKMIKKIKEKISSS